MSEQQPLFKNADEFEETYVGHPRPEPTAIPPKSPNPALEHGMMTTPPLYRDEEGIIEELPDLEVENEENDLRLEDPTNADAG